MVDDGLLLNFSSTQDALLPFKPSFRGGRWRDRLLAKKSVLRRQAKTAAFAKKPQASILVSKNGDPTPDDTENLNNERSVKRQRIEEPTPSAVSSQVSNKSETRTDNSIQKPVTSVKPREFISSLFTSNPAPVSKRENTEKVGDDAGKIEASNAPLEGELYNFTSLGISKELALHLLTRLNVKAPTAIQENTIPHLLQNDTDTFIKAETGSGKTLAYLLPIVQRIIALREAASEKLKESEISRQSGLFAIILAPTRELCKQISVVLENVLRWSHSVVPGAISGGEKKKSEKARLRKGINILVATPGRLMDHLQHTEALITSNVRWLVLDEGDRLMELGFEEQIQRIIGQLNISQSARSSTEVALQGLPKRRITVLCSATLKTDVQKLGELSLKGAKHIQVQASTTDKISTDAGKGTDAYSIPAQLRQSYALVPAKLRLVTLNALLKHSFSRRGSVMKAIVFVSCADSVDFHFSVFTQSSHEELDNENVENKEPKDKSAKTQVGDGAGALAPAISSDANKVRMYKLHGSLPQYVRKATLASFSGDREPVVLICTDVASRGLDVPNVDLVVEYDPPFCEDDHFHRIGRTARAGKDGRAMIFLQPGDEEGYINILKRGQKETSRNLTRHDADDILRKGFYGVKKSTDGRSCHVQATDWQLNIERWALQNEKYLEEARRAYQSHIRAYATHVANERGIFNIKNLHLGHLAKAFALRDKPKSIRVPGLRPDQDDTKAANSARKAMAQSAFGKGAQSLDSKRTVISVNTNSVNHAAHKMRAKLKEHVSEAAEFNIG